MFHQQLHQPPPLILCSAPAVHRCRTEIIRIWGYQILIGLLRAKCLIEVRTWAWEPCGVNRKEFWFSLVIVAAGVEQVQEVVVSILMLALEEGEVWFLKSWIQKQEKKRFGLAVVYEHTRVWSALLLILVLVCILYKQYNWCQYSSLCVIIGVNVPKFWQYPISSCGDNIRLIYIVASRENRRSIRVGDPPATSPGDPATALDNIAAIMHQRKQGWNNQ